MGPRGALWALLLLVAVILAALLLTAAAAARSAAPPSAEGGAAPGRAPLRGGGAFSGGGARVPPRVRAPTEGRTTAEEVRRIRRQHTRPADVPAGARRPPVRTAVVVPFRDGPGHVRRGHLEALLPALGAHPGLDVFVAEQAPGEKFNLGLVRNAGFLAAVRRGVAQGRPYGAVVFNDVDLVPDAAMLAANYGPSPLRPTSLYTRASEQASGAKYRARDFYAGLSAWRPGDFEKVGGFPVRMFGWGSEDQILRTRIARAGVATWRATEGRFRELPHPPTEGDPGAVALDRWDLEAAEDRAWRATRRQVDTLADTDAAAEVTALGERATPGGGRLVRLLVAPRRAPPAPGMPGPAPGPGGPN